MSWRMDSSAGAAIWDSEPFSGDDVLCRNEELAWLMSREMRGQRAGWDLINGRISRSRRPTALNSPYDAPLVQVPTGSTPTAATGAASVLGWWTSTLFTPFILNGPPGGAIFQLLASGTVTSSSTAQTMTMNPGVGATNVNAAPGSNVTLGASGAISLGASSAQTAMLWRLGGEYTVRRNGASGLLYASFEIKITNVAGTSTSIVQDIFGYTEASADFTATPTGGVSGQTAVIAGTASATAVSVSAHQVHWMSRN